MAYYNYNKNDILRVVEEEDVQFVRLQFVDILGTLKNVAITVDQLEMAMENQLIIDGSSIEGFVRHEEFDMVLHPDLSTFKIFPWRPSQGKVARLICDIYKGDGTPFLGDPRQVLKKVIDEAKSMGFELSIGPEFEFFLFQTDENGEPTTITHDNAGYFDLGPIDLGENVRRDMILTLQEMGFVVKASHHEVAPGQHEIDFQYSDALDAADNISTFKLVVKVIAQKHGLHATFMPKPIENFSGSGMHLNIKLRDVKGNNVFYSKEDDNKLSDHAKYFMGGLMKHAKALSAVTNPTVNSYKRLVPGFEAPVYIGYSKINSSPFIRIPTIRDEETVLELRSPDPSCNPYLAIAMILKAGMDGIKYQLDPGPMLTKEALGDMVDIFNVGNLMPSNLKEALIELNNDSVLKEALEDVFEYYVKAKKIEWLEYERCVHQWELNKYLSKY